MGQSAAIHVIFRSSVRACLLVILIVPFGGRVCAQDRGNPNWYARVVPYFWFSNVDGNQILGDFHIPVTDTVLLPDVALRLEAGRGRWRGLVHLFRSHRRGSAITTRISDPADSAVANYNFTWLTTELLAAVQIGPFTNGHAVELYAGGRYVRHRQHLDVTGNSDGPMRTTESWIDPIVGTRMFIELSRYFWTTISTDIGGFGVGSELTWSREGELGFHVIHRVDLTLRYTYLQVQFDNKNDGLGRYAWDGGVAQGWLFGVVLRI